jgi:hypothetical protein
MKKAKFDHEVSPRDTIKEKKDENCHEECN